MAELPNTPRLPFMTRMALVSARDYLLWLVELKGIKAGAVDVIRKNIDMAIAEDDKSASEIGQCQKCGAIASGGSLRCSLPECPGTKESAAPLGNSVGGLDQRTGYKPSDGGPSSATQVCAAPDDKPVPTPRTDALAAQLQGTDIHYWWQSYEHLASDLERELAEERQRQDDRDRMYDMHVLVAPERHDFLLDCERRCAASIEPGKIKKLLGPDRTHQPEERTRKALSEAAYALFQIKRMVGVPQHVIDFVRAEHAKACAVLNDEPLSQRSES